VSGKIIEITQVTVVSGGALSPKKRMIGAEHIVSIGSGAHNTSVIELSSGEKLNVKETYDELKALVGA
jgi:hypothetical protein